MALTSDKNAVTIKAWENKFDVVTETARQDLFFLEEIETRNLIFQKCQHLIHVFFDGISINPFNDIVFVF